MDRLKCMMVFLEVAGSGSFGAAASNLGMSRAAVTKHVARLEAILGTRLLNRTTKQVGLTEAGLLVVNSGNAWIQGYEAIQADVLASTRTPGGVIRIGTPPAFGTRHLLPLVHEFTMRHPDIQVVLVLDVGDANLITRGLDMSIRITTTLQDASYVAVPLTKAPQVLVASPDYLARDDVSRQPAELSDLISHNCLVHSIKSPTNLWRFVGPGKPTSIRVRGTLASDFGEVLLQAALSGYGISMHPYYMVSDDLAQGRLLPVLPQYEPEPHEVHLVYSSRKGLPERARRFVSFVREWAQTPPAWSTRRLPGYPALPGASPRLIGAAKMMRRRASA